MECQRVNNKEAAKLLGMSVARMQALMDRKLIDIGVVIQPMPGYKKRSIRCIVVSSINGWGLRMKKSRLPTKTTCKG